ncbi:MAG: cytochrome c [Candidatus Eremiobacteraeota bacterium]|nr:cytochrome c [Candidatus Eremiobacteraeota bacterium]
MMKLLVIAVILATLAPAPPSYTETQATKGQILFYEQCAECHGAALDGNFGPALSGDGGNLQWATVSYVWQYVTAHMPAGNAGGLSTTDYLEIMAFLLKAHGNPAGKAPLTPQAALASKALLGP